MIKKINLYKEPIDIYTMIIDEPYSFILESSLYDKKYGRYSIVSASPFETVDYTDDPECIEKFRLIMNKYTKNIKNKNNYNNDNYNNDYNNNKTDNNYNHNNKINLPFTGGAVGYLSYDLGRYIETISERSKKVLDIPDLYFGLYDWAYVVDHKLKVLYIVTPDIDEVKEKEIIIQREKAIYDYKPIDTENGIENNAENNIEKKMLLKSNFTKKEYIDSVEKVRDYIKNGDIYQANLTQRFEGKTNRSAYDIYQDLRRIGPTIFGGMLNFEKVQVISNSPERFIKINDEIIESRPIKGTRPRGKDELEDKKFKDELINSEKDKAELLMIVDLVRNDLGRVSEIGSVKVPELFKLEAYANVYHLVSTIKSKMDSSKDIYDVIKSTFPGGSITGAPKIRAMEIIEELEPTRRNVYTGSVGYIGFDGKVDLNIAIRTIVKKDNNITFQVGGGITWDSNPEDEYMETLHKAKSIIETLRGYIDDNQN